jgi:hypothetical protein
MGGPRLGEFYAVDLSPDGEGPTCATTEQECEAGFEPAGVGLGVPRPFLIGSHMCFRLAVALLVVLGLTGRLDASTANALVQIILP